MSEYHGAFTDGNGHKVTRFDLVEYRFGGRRGILLEALQDGDASVWFEDKEQCEMVKWINLCKINANDLDRTMAKLKMQGII